MNKQFLFNSKIKINGKEYNSINDIPRELIPEKFKKYLEDKDGNNIPDIIEGKPQNKPKPTQTATSSAPKQRTPSRRAININNFAIFKFLLILALIGGLIYYFVNNF